MYTVILNTSAEGRKITPTVRPQRTNTNALTVGDIGLFCCFKSSLDFYMDANTLQKSDNFKMVTHFCLHVHQLKFSYSVVTFFILMAGSELPGWPEGYCANISPVWPRFVPQSWHIKRFVVIKSNRWFFYGTLVSCNSKTEKNIKKSCHNS